MSTLFHYGDNDAEGDKRAFTRALNRVGLYTLELLDKKDCTLNQFTEAVDTLASYYPLLQPRLLKGLSDCAKHDDIVSPIEREMISAIAAGMA